MEAKTKAKKFISKFLASLSKALLKDFYNYIDSDCILIYNTLTKYEIYITILNGPSKNLSEVIEYQIKSYALPLNL